MKAEFCDKWVSTGFQGQWKLLRSLSREELLNSEWVSIKTDRDCKITKIRGYVFTLLHAKGRVTEKQDHYFVSDYYPKRDE